jgi:hypothetical protein
VTIEKLRDYCLNPTHRVGGNEAHVFASVLGLTVAHAEVWQQRLLAVARTEEPVGWQRWRRQLMEHNRDQAIVCAQGAYGIFHLAVFALLMGVKRQDVPPELGARREILAKYDLPPKG